MLMFWYFVIGSIAGLMSGLFGIGGGLVIIPALTFVFSYYNKVPNVILMQAAIGTSLAVIIVTSASSLFAYQKRNAIQWHLIKILWPGIIIGVILGVLTASLLSSHYLQILFSFFLFYVAIRLIKKQPIGLVVKSAPGVNIIRLFSVAIGALSSIVGVGGGVLLVPFLLRCKLNLVSAIGTSVVCTMIIGLVATLSFMAEASLSLQNNYIYWPAFLGVAISSILFAPMGVYLAHRLPTEIVRKFFAALLFLTAFTMLVKLL